MKWQKWQIRFIKEHLHLKDKVIAIKIGRSKNAVMMYRYKHKIWKHFKSHRDKP
jgi:hypothetical protein